jgi:glutaredoxin-like protein NrdH
MEVKIWTKSNCVQCEQTKKQFVKEGVKYKEYNLEENLDQLEEFKEQGLMSAPIIESEIGTWSGFRLDKIRDLSVAQKAREGRDG